MCVSAHLFSCCSLPVLCTTMPLYHNPSLCHSAFIILIFCSSCISASFYSIEDARLKAEQEEKERLERERLEREERERIEAAVGILT